MTARQHTCAPRASEQNEEPLLRVSRLTVSVKDTAQKIVDDLSIEIFQNEVVAMVGESGSGKSVTALSLAQLLPDQLHISGGEISFEGKSIVDQSEATLNRMRGADISMLFQQPHVMLDPTSRVRVQVGEPLRQHRKFSRRRAFSRVLELLKEVGIPAPESRAKSFSHELSGGMAQRVMIAAAVAADPKLLIADEPTTALDVTVQAQILRLLKAEQVRRNFAILLITHDLSIVSAVSDRVAIMYAGQIVEQGSTELIMHAPAHPYTRALIRCSLLLPQADGRLTSIPGSSAQSLTAVDGCRFAPRCALAQADGNLLSRCTATEPVLRLHQDGREIRCHAVMPATGEGT